MRSIRWQPELRVWEHISDSCREFYWYQCDMLLAYTVGQHHPALESAQSWKINLLSSSNPSSIGVTQFTKDCSCKCSVCKICADNHLRQWTSVTQLKETRIITLDGALDTSRQSLFTDSNNIIWWELTQT